MGYCGIQKVLNINELILGEEVGFNVSDFISNIIALMNNSHA